MSQVKGTCSHQPARSATTTQASNHHLTSQQPTKQSIPSSLTRGPGPAGRAGGWQRCRGSRSYGQRVRPGASASAETQGPVQPITMVLHAAYPPPGLNHTVSRGPQLHHLPSAAAHNSTLAHPPSASHQIACKPRNCGQSSACATSAPAPYHVLQTHLSNSSIRAPARLAPARTSVPCPSSSTCLNRHGVCALSRRCEWCHGQQGHALCSLWPTPANRQGVAQSAAWQHSWQAAG